MNHRALSISAPTLAALLLLACQAPEPQAPPGAIAPYGQPPPGQYVPPQAQPQQPSAPNGAIGQALTPFGMLSQLPQIFSMPGASPQQPGAPQQPLPDLAGWLRAYWPSPQGQPPAQPQQPQQPQQPFPGAPVSQPYEDEVLALTNQRRAQGAVCGDKAFGPAGALAPNAQLQAAARGHSRDMATRGYFDHRSPEGAGPADRARAVGYPSGFIGENIAAGQPTPAAVVDGWMKSPGHCLNIMEPRYRFLGVGLHQGAADRYGSYWTQNFGG